jgi:phospholipid/cholesterol/gamma-HCH transport system substrate-binding protein
MPAPEKSFTGTEIKAGAMVLAAVVVFAVFAAALAGMRVPRETRAYHTRFADTLGLSEQAVVRFGGVKAGNVTRFEQDPDNPTLWRVHFVLDPAIPVNEASVAFVGQTTLTAEKHLEVTTGAADAPRLAPGAGVPSQSKDLFGLADQVGGKVAEVLDVVKAILGGEKYALNAEDAAAAGKPEIVTVPDVLDNTNAAVATLADMIEDNRESVEEVVAKLLEIETSAKRVVDTVADAVEENRPDVRETVTNLREVSARARAMAADVEAVTARLEGMADTLEQVLQNSQALTDEARGLVENNRPLVEDLLLDLRETVRHAKEFTRALKEQPQSILRGMQPLGRGAE